MAQIIPGRSQNKPQRVRGIVQTLVRHGRLIAQSWPRPRGTPKQLYQIANLERFKISNQVVKHIYPKEQKTMHDGLKEFLDKNEGLRGTAAIRLRDWMTAVIYGRAWSVTTPDGVTIYPVTVRQDASDILDTIDPFVGSLLVRTDDAWLPTVQCKPGNIMLMTPELLHPLCCPLAQRATNQTTVGGF